MFVTLGIGLPIATIATAVAITKYHLNGEDLSKFDGVTPDAEFDTDPNSEGAQAVNEYLRKKFIAPAQEKISQKEKLARKRRMFDEIGLIRDFDCEFRSDTAVFDGIEVDGEWTLPEGADPDKRILYLHGGANTVGSAISHRPIITNLANRTRCAIFAPNYRLLPENARIDGIKDCRAAYQWLCDHGPEGARPAKSVAIGGDSAGANLTLSIINWIRDSDIRKPDAAFVISPATDSTCTSPSLRENIDTDLMLQPLAAPLLKIPRPALLWALWRTNKISPSDPVVSPVFSDLSDLPPILIHVSSAEILFDDARRYAAKAKAAGSPVTLHIWHHMAHVWHAFDRMLPEAHDAFDDIAKFLKKNGCTNS